MGSHIIKIPSLCTLTGAVIQYSSLEKSIPCYLATIYLNTASFPRLVRRGTAAIFYSTIRRTTECERMNGLRLTTDRPRKYTILDLTAKE